MSPCTVEMGAVGTLNIIEKSGRSTWDLSGSLNMLVVKMWLVKSSDASSSFLTPLQTRETTVLIDSLVGQLLLIWFREWNWTATSHPRLDFTTDSLPAHMLRYYTENVQFVIPLFVHTNRGLGRNKSNLQYHLNVSKTILFAFISVRKKQLKYGPSFTLTL